SGNGRRPTEAGRFVAQHHGSALRVGYFGSLAEAKSVLDELNIRVLARHPKPVQWGAVVARRRSVVRASSAQRLAGKPDLRPERRGGSGGRGDMGGSARCAVGDAVFVADGGSDPCGTIRFGGSVSSPTPARRDGRAVRDDVRDRARRSVPPGTSLKSTVFPDA